MDDKRDWYSSSIALSNFIIFYLLLIRILFRFDHKKIENKIAKYMNINLFFGEWLNTRTYKILILSGVHALMISEIVRQSCVYVHDYYKLQQ